VLINLDQEVKNNLKINIMPILTILLIIIIVGVLLWLANTYLPMDATIKKILNIVVIILLVIWLLKVLGAFTYLGHIKI
jgi:hypothetical protein